MKATPRSTFPGLSSCSEGSETGWKTRFGRDSLGRIPGRGPPGSQHRLGVSMSKIVISYRRSSYDAIVGRIRDKLVGHYGDDAVYMDVDNIPYGIDFRQHINKALSEGDVVVAIIGPKWLGPIRGRKARIFDDADPVRVEIEIALSRGIAVVPILVDGARMPKATDLPDSISQLAYHNAATVDAGRDFHQHMERVIRSMELVVDKAPDKASKPLVRKRLVAAASAFAGALALAV